MTARFNVGWYRRDQHRFHLGEPRDDFGLSRSDVVAEIVYREELSEVERLAVVDILRIDMHQTGPDQLYAGAGEHIGLDGEIVDMDLLHARRRFDLDQPP